MVKYFDEQNADNDFKDLLCFLYFLYNARIIIQRVLGSAGKSHQHHKGGYHCETLQ